jgi:hypothetical protein
MSASETHHAAFLDEVWLTPLQIARRFGYATDKPVRKAIMHGELKATRGPCRRKLLVAESEVLRWIESALAFEPTVAPLDQPVTSTARPSSRGRRSTVPRLSYDASRTKSA